MGALIIISSFIYTLSSVFCFIKIKDKCINFLPFYLVSEYFYFIGLVVFPISLVFEFFTIPDYYPNYLSLDDFSLLTPLHIIFYSLGMLLGVSSNLWVKLIRNKLIRISEIIYISPFHLLSLFAIISLSAFLFLIITYGFTEFISTSTLRRSGYGKDTVVADLAFLTNIITLGTFVVCIYPYYLERHKNIRITTLFIYIIGIVIYLSTVSRYALMQTIILPFMVYYTYNSNKIASKIKLILISFIALIILFYGKFIVDYISASISGETIEIIEESDKLSRFIGNFGHLFFSIDAGIQNFFIYGKIILKDVILAPLGIVPSSIFKSLGLENLSHQLLTQSERTDCINTSNLGIPNECYVPPYYTGVSAYLLPLVFGFLFGYIRYSFYAAIAEAYKFFQKNNIVYIPMVLLVFLTFESFIIFIPSAIANTVFLWILLFSLKLYITVVKK